MSDFLEQRRKLGRHWPRRVNSLPPLGLIQWVLEVEQRDAATSLLIRMGPGLGSSAGGGGGITNTQRVKTPGHSLPGLQSKRVIGHCVTEEAH